jgi:hypothetical protein
MAVRCTRPSARYGRSTFCRNSASNEGRCNEVHGAGRRRSHHRIAARSMPTLHRPAAQVIAMGDGGSLDVPVDARVGGRAGTRQHRHPAALFGPQDGANGSFVAAHRQHPARHLQLRERHRDRGPREAPTRTAAAIPAGYRRLARSSRTTSHFAPLAASPLLARLANNGWTDDHAPPDDHRRPPAIGRVPLADCLDPDQRYYRTTNGSCDAGPWKCDGAPPRPTRCSRTASEG